MLLEVQFERPFIYHPFNILSKYDIGSFPYMRKIMIDYS